jgi:hypothetical protein
VYYTIGFAFGGSGPDITAHGSLDLKQEIQIQTPLVRKINPNKKNQGGFIE